MQLHAQGACRFVAVEEALRICETGRLEEPVRAAARAPIEANPANPPAAAAPPAAKPAPAADAAADDDALAPAKACCPCG